MIKQSKVVFISKEVEDNFNCLEQNDIVRKGIIKAVIQLQKNAFSGTQIPKKLIPREYVLKYQINNLWKINLAKGWRLLYTVTPENEIELIAAIMDWSDHKEYERKFKY